MVDDEQFEPCPALCWLSVVLGFGEWYDPYLLQELQDVLGIGLMLKHHCGHSDVLATHEPVGGVV